MNMSLAYQLQNDVREASKSSPDQFVEPGTQIVYNNLLDEAQRRYSSHLIGALPRCDHETKYKDLNVLVGQMVAALRQLNPLTPSDPQAFYGGGSTD